MWHIRYRRLILGLCTSSWVITAKLSGSSRLTSLRISSPLHPGRAFSIRSIGAATPCTTVSIHSSVWMVVACRGNCTCASAKLQFMKVNEVIVQVGSASAVCNRAQQAGDSTAICTVSEVMQGTWSMFCSRYSSMPSGRATVASRRSLLRNDTASRWVTQMSSSISAGSLACMSWLISPS
ncbi:hypothetical protein FQZ97_824200 [compost metagenome]